MPQSFKQPNGDKTKNLKGVVKWFTNLDVKPRKETMSLTYSYYDNPELYPKYDNYDAINIDKTKMIPYDYDGYMGVPFTFLEYYNPEQFEILGMLNGTILDYDFGKALVNGKELFTRIIIKNKQPEKY